MPLVLGRRSEEPRSPAVRLNVVAITVFVLFAAAGWLVFAGTGRLALFVALVLAGLVAMQSPRVAQQWERAVMLRLGRFVGLAGPGPVLGRPVHRSRLELDRPAHHHHQLRRRADADR